MSKPKKRYRLSNVIVDELSLVDKAAVSHDGMGRNFFLYKQLTDSSLPSFDQLTEEQKQELNKQFNSLSEKEKQQIMKELESVSAELDEPEDEEWENTKRIIEKLSVMLEALKKENRLLYAEVMDYPQNFTIDLETFEISRKPDAPPPKPTKVWDELSQRWVVQKQKLVTLWDRYNR